MSNLWTTVAIALCAGAVSGTLVVSLTRTGQVTKPLGPTVEQADLGGMRSGPTLIEHQVIVHDPAPVQSGRVDQNEGSAKLDPKASEPVNLAADMESMFQNDHPSNDDGRKSESALRMAFRNPDLKGVRIDRIDCRAVTCRVEVTFDSHEADADALHKLLADPTGILSLGKSVAIPIRNTLSDGKIAATMYFYPSMPSPPRPGEGPPS